MSLGTAIGVATTPFAFISSATRHVVDTATFGSASDRYNARDEYRREYTPVERAGAGFGAVAGTALPGLALAKWWSAGHPVPQVLANAPRWGKGMAVAVAAGAGLGMTAVGASKTAQMVFDDGNAGVLGTAAGVVGGAVAGIKIGSKFGSTWRPPAFGGLVGMVAGGVLGNLAGDLVPIGTSKIGVEHPQAPNVDSNAGERSRSFGAGLWNHFTEFGPISQGQGNAQVWGMRETFHDKYSNAERGGALNGDLLAAGAMGAAAVGVTSALLGSRSKQVRLASGQVLSPVASAADRAARVTQVGVVNAAARRGFQLLDRFPGVTGAGIALATGAVATGYIAQREANAWKDEHHGRGGGTAALATVGATVGLGALLSRAPAFGGLSLATKVGGSTLAASSIIGVLSSARIGLWAFHQDAKDAESITPADPTTRMVMGTAMGGLGGVVGVRTAAKKISEAGVDIAIPLINKNLHIARVPAVALVTAGAIGVGAMAGSGISPTLPSLGTVGVAAGAGAALTGAGVLGLRSLTERGMTSVLANNPDIVRGGMGRAMQTLLRQPGKVAALGAVGGAVAGAMSASMWKTDAPARVTQR